LIVLDDNHHVKLKHAYVAWMLVVILLNFSVE